MTDERNDMERRVDQVLQGLPAPRAPRSLLPRVMAAVAEARRPWYARAWRTWPLAWQIASAVACALVAAGASMSVPAVQAFAGAHASPALAALLTHVLDVAARTEDARRAAEIVWRVAIAPAAAVALVPVLLMCGASVAFGAALGRLALGGVSRS